MTRRTRLPVVSAFGLLAAVACEAATDRGIYVVHEPGTATFHNMMEGPAYLSECEPFHFELFVPGGWEDRGTARACTGPDAWFAVESGKVMEFPFESPGEAGLWRLNFTVALHCKERPWGASGCGPVWHAVTAPFDVEQASSSASQADELSGDIAEDSEIELAESAGYAVYRADRITIITKDRATTLKRARDGVERQGTMPLPVAIELWRFLLDLGVEQMDDARPELMPPDAAGFTLTLRLGSTKHAFTAYAVNSLPDDRYRKAIEKVLQTAEAHLPEQ